MSATRIIGQSIPCLLNAFPGWKQPVHCRAVGTAAGGAGALTMNTAKTTPGVTITGGSGGVYKITFPNCRDVAGINVQVFSPTPETPGASYAAGIDADTAETNATTGEIAFTTYARDNGDDEALPNGNIVDATFWADMG